jgi:hypothetical protein
MTRSEKRRLATGVLFAAAIALAPLATWAEACHDYTTPIPDCETQTMATIHYGAWQTRGWAYYCTGDHPYFWGSAEYYAGNYSQNNNCFSVTENPFVETTPNKFDATITNWCLKGEDITITLGCSDAPPPGYLPACTYVGGPVHDPGCPQANAHNYCSTTNPPVCFQTFTETCGSTTYDCTIDLLVTWCNKCQ